ncbi:MAG: radical SAM protein [Thermodesulfovibrionales bacterium]|nr:radical SAM protein [Thermodesulfovibrionales bacterium]
MKIESKEKVVEELYNLLRECRLCPRNCRVNRLEGKKGFCRTGSKPVISSWGPHFGEERPLVGRFGSGTIFFTHCNLGCLYCQNWTISHLGEGEETTVERLANIMLMLQSEGCHNINLVTPTHQTPMIVEAIFIARDKGLEIPVVYNCGGYESVETLRLLDGIIDIYMPDIKYMSGEFAKKYSLAPDYPEIVKAAVKEMHRQVGDLLIDQRGIAVKGLLVRHLVLPNDIAQTEEVVKFIAQEISKNTYINIMDQYRPCYRAFEFPELSRRITPGEYESAIKAALKAGLKRIDGVTV